MKKLSQWLQYLTALSLTLSTTAFALPASAAPADEVRISPQAAAKLNSMAETQATATDQNAQLAEWLQWIQVWLQWVQIISPELPVENVTPGGDFDSFGALLDRVKNES
jgi:hypothetical protein